MKVYILLHIYAKKDEDQFIRRLIYEGIFLHFSQAFVSVIRCHLVKNRAMGKDHFTPPAKAILADDKRVFFIHVISGLA